MGIREERLARAATMPHRAAAGENSIDARLESTIGRFYFHGHITEPEFEAGIRYGQIILRYLQSIDAPSPYGHGFDDIAQTDAGREVIDRGGFRIVNTPGKYERPAEFAMRDLSDDECFKRKVAATQARQILKDAANASRTPQTRVITAVDRLTVYGESPRDEREMRALRIGLRALACGSNVIPFGRPARQPVG